MELVKDGHVFELPSAMGSVKPLNSLNRRVT